MSTADLPFNNNIISKWLSDINIGILIYNQKNIIYKNVFFQENLDTNSYLQLLSLDDINNETDRFNAFLNNNIESDALIYIKKTLYNVNFTIQKTLYIITFIKMNSKNVFLENLSHQLRIPISGIIGMMILLEETPLNIEQIEYIEMIKECSFTLMAIVNDILDYSKIESDKIVLDIKCLNIRKIIESTNDIITGKLYQKGNQIQYKCFIDPNVPENTMVDSNRLKQVLLNLLNNAIKYTNKGIIKLRVMYIGENNYQFTVSDTGCGIKPKDVALLFKSFDQPSDKRGIGLGLVLSKYLVHLMNGQIYLESSSSEGSTFVFNITIQPCMCKIKNKLNDTVLHDRNIMIVDNNYQSRIQLSDIVNKWEMNPMVFSTVEEAEYFIKVYPSKFHIGIIDSNIPGFYNFIKKCKIPLIGLSNISKLREYDLSEKYCVQSFIAKPINMEKLQNMLITIFSTINYSISTQDNLLDSEDIVRILVVEDVYINQKIIVKFLKKIGYTNILVVENGNECIDILKTNEFDIILLNIRMPILNGEQVLKCIKGYYQGTDTMDLVFKNKNMPYIIAMTAFCKPDDKQRFLLMGFSDYLGKPININQLKDALVKFKN